MTKAKNKSGIGFILFACWLVYSSSYLGKVNFSANKLAIINYFNVNEAQVGLVGTFFFFAYGVCMVLNGIFCKKYNVKYMVFSSLIISALVNLSIALLPKSAFGVIKFLWMINGMALSVLWPTLIRLLSETLPKKRMPSASKVMGTTVATGTFLIYGISALFAHFNLSYTLSFIVPAVVSPAVAVFWILFYNKFTNINQDTCEVENEQKTNDASNDRNIELKNGENSSLQNVQNHKNGMNKTNLFAIICCLALFAVVTNLVKDGLIGWVPKILKDNFNLPDSLSILMTLALPIMGITANFVTVWIASKFKNYVLLEGVLFLIGGLIVLAITFLLSTNLITLTFLLTMAVSFIASGSNNVITSIFPLYMKGKVNSGLIAGVLNGFCYLGSTISDYGLGVVKVITGSWTSVFYVLLIACFISVAVALIFNMINNLKRK